MAIVRLQHIGIVVRDFKQSWDKFEQQFGMPPRDFRDDQGGGKQHDARVLLGNDCWIHIVHNWNPESRVYQFLDESGERLEHIAIESNDIEADVKRVRDMNVPIFKDKIFDANDGYEAFVYPGDGIGFTVELIQPHVTSWVYPDDAQGKAVSNRLGILRADHLTAVVADVGAAARRFGELFNLPIDKDRVAIGENCSLKLVQDSAGEPRDRGLDRLVLETRSLSKDLQILRESGVSVSEDGVVAPEPGRGFEVELSVVDA
jgi:methylmalonyl-CoA/ethylmalonyl-CoA epimerase